MQIKQTLINHLVKVLAEQLRKAESLNGKWGAGRQRADACAEVNKIVALLEGYGVEPDIAFEAAETLNDSLVV